MGVTSTESMRVALPDAGTAQTGAADGANRARSVAVIVLGLVLLAALTLTSLLVGSGDMTARQAWESLLNPGDTTNDVIVHTLRIPRTQLAVLVGAALGLAGVLIQAVTRNPLADPGILGVNAGAYLAVSVGAAYFGVNASSDQVWWSIVGAVMAAVVVYLIGAAEGSGANPATLVLSGVALGAVLTGMSTAISLANPEVFDKLRFWAAGSLQGREADTVAAVLPFIIVGLVVAVALARPLNVFSLGEDLARALGARVMLTRSFALVAITLLCGAATAAAGPITFFGLMVAFVARLIVGPDLRWVVAMSLVFAPSMFLASDILGRLLVPSELPVGVVTAFLGAPLLIVLIRRRGASL